ncbi:hypothetical protein, unknown function [Leishmania tarentolae]|uniref:Uncharacterized protein n=1 Tax=Leishmania tarentolae TaxID=5689 RepID=A0A640L108_LEITA|nr:hypothetical protein, unknown function [Leishmania tarentolae]
MPRNHCRSVLGQQSNVSVASQATPAPADSAHENTRELAPISSTSEPPVRAKSGGRGRTRVNPRKTSSKQSLPTQLLPADTERGNDGNALTATALTPAVSNHASITSAIANSAATENQHEVAQITGTCEAAAGVSAELPLPLSLSPFRASFSSSRITDPSSLVTGVPADTVQGGKGTATISSLAPLHLSTRVETAAPEGIVANEADLTTAGAQPFFPSMAACMAACFGWRLQKCSVGEEAQITFVLQHWKRPVVRVTIESSGSAFAQACAVSSEVDADAVCVNGIPMSLPKCAAYLQELTHALLALSDTSGSGPLTDEAPRAEEGDSAEEVDEKSVSSPTVQAPPLLSPNEQAKVAERRAKKRARCCSPLRNADSTASVTRATELLSGTTVQSPTEGSPLKGRDEEEASRRGQHPHSLPLNPCNVSLAPASPATMPPVSLAAADIKGEAESPQLLMASPRASERETDVDTQSLSTLSTLVASMEGGESSTLLSRALSTPRTNTDKLTLASRRALPSVDKNTATRESPTSSTVFASPTMRQRRTLAPATASAAAGPVSAVTGDDHAPLASLTPPHVAPRTATFTMPFAFHHVPTAPLAAGAAVGEFDASSCTTGSSNGYRSVWCNSAGWSTDSSRLWLAHTHAVSRAFRCMPVPCCGVSATAKTTEARGGEGAQRHRPSTTTSASSTVQPMDSAAAAARVRMTLRWRWRERSSIWTAMEGSLRMAVSSGHLRGDALEAGVQALQTSEDEQRRYDGVDADDTEEGSDPTSTCGRIAVDVGQVGDVAERQQTPPFPACPPRALMPVSGRAVVEAQHRITDSEEERGGEEGVHGPRYMACAGGIPYADRIVIDHTYSTRGSYVIASPMTAESTAATSCRLLTVQRNPQEDLHYHVYKRFMPTDMRLAMEAEGTPAVEAGVTAPLQGVSVELLPAYKLRRNQSGGEGDDNEDDEERDDGGDDADEKKVGDVPYASQTAPKDPAATTLTDAGGGGSFTDMDDILRHRSSIRHIPMPDVESRYGP